MSTPAPTVDNGADAARGALPAGALAGFAVLYFLLDWVSFVHPMRGTNITPWNPQAALAVALLTRAPRYAGLAVATMVAAVIARSGFAAGAADAAASAAQGLGYLVIALALRRWLGPSPWMGRRIDYLLFLVIAFAGALLSSALYVVMLALAGSPASDRLPAAFLRAATGDMVSLVVSLPAVLALADATRRSQGMAMLRTVEWWLVAGAAMLAAYAVFGQPAEEQFKYFYLLFLPVAWAAARFGNVGAAWSAALVQVLLIVAVQGAGFRPQVVFEFHMLLAALGATGLLLGATVEEREEAARALRASLHAAAAADMAAALAHELNQPLTALRTYARAAQLLAQGSPAPAEARNSLVEVTGKLVAEASRAGEVVKRLRDFFRQRGTELQRLPLAPLVVSVLQSQALRAETEGVSLEAECEPSLPAVWLDPVQITVVLRNLVANALDAAVQEPAPHPWVKVRARVAEDRLLVQVVDSGAGIPSQELAQVFESRRSSKPGGMGVGLMISRSIVEAHEGRLWAEPGPGGKFCFTLPLTAEEAHE